MNKFEMSNDQWMRASIPAAIEMLRSLRLLLQTGYKPVDALLLASITELHQGQLQDMYARGCVELVITPAQTALAALSTAVKARTGMDNMVGQLTAADAMTAEDALGETLYGMDREFWQEFKRRVSEDAV